MIIILPVIAGLSTLLGIIPTYFSINKNIIINYSLKLTIGILLIIIIFNLIPESYHYLNKNIFQSTLLIIIFISLGIIINIIIDRFIDNSNKLYRLGILSMLTIVLHNIPEGIITMITSSTNIKLGIITSLAIMLHNIPEGMSIAIPIYYATNNHKKAFLYTLIAGFSELFGVLISLLFLKNIISDFKLSAILGITAGIMIYLIISLLTNKKEDYSS
ncbi:MAG: ZIP family metal transporter [Bacilli bacterium]|nr:ZIP family metal transporter [Bacilli bacterium]